MQKIITHIIVYNKYFIKEFIVKQLTILKYLFILLKKGKVKLTNIIFNMYLFLNLINYTVQKKSIFFFHINRS